MHLPLVAASIITTLVTATTALAEIPINQSSNSITQPGSATLITQPASINSPAPNLRFTQSPLSLERLNNIAGSLGNRSGGAAKVAPRSLDTPSNPATKTDPIEFFKVPPLNGGVKLNVLEN